MNPYPQVDGAPGALYAAPDMTSSAVLSMAAQEAQLWALVGPTAAGKSAIAQVFAPSIDAEIISVDAVAVYRGCNVGSAKPSLAQRAAVPHHLIDCADPNEPFDASQFVDGASRAIRTIRAAGKTPLLCGGTGLYLRALRLGLIDVPTDATLRAELLRGDQNHPLSSYRRLQVLDPQSAEAIDPRNSFYVRRALEVTLLCGMPASAVRARHRQLQQQMPMQMWWIDRSDACLRRRIHQRTQKMIHGGLLQEIATLLAAGVSRQSNPLRAVGYREGVAVVDGQLPLAKLQTAIERSTWQYVRRQRTWLRREQRASPTLLQKLQLQDAADDAQSAHEGAQLLLRAWQHRRG